MATKTQEPIASLKSYQGSMTKRIIDMDSIEREAYYKAAALKVRERLFKIGQPLVYKKGEEVVAEQANGLIEIIR